MRARVALDAHGSDENPGPEVAGALAAIAEAQTEIVLVGDQPRLEAEVRKLRGNIPAELSFVHAPDVITMEDAPAKARRKKDASMVRAFDLVKAHQAEAVVTAGNSGAAMMLGTLVVGRLPGVIRPAIVNHFPTIDGGTTIMLDMGANVDCKPEWLAQFATMGSIYARSVLKIAEPRVGLVANGTEEGKGSESVRATHELLKTAPVKYIGLVEPHELFKGGCDVFVVDGFAGNLILKTTEGVVDAVFTLLKREIKARPLAMLGAMLAAPAFRAVKAKSDYDEYGAATLLGVDGAAFIGHGRSNPKAIKNAIKFARRMVESGANEAIASGLAANPPERISRG